MAKKFSEMGITTGPGDSKMFDCEKVSISDIVNIEIEVIDFVGGIKTTYGEDRYIINFRLDGKEKKFFTTSKSIMSALDQIPKEDFPFTTTVRTQNFGGKHKGYQFT